jgi:hypothetical protein
MTKKEVCKKIMMESFGPASARLVENMTEEECVGICRKKVATFLGEEKAVALFDSNSELK